MTTTPARPVVSSTVLVVGMVVVFCFTLAAVVVITVAVPNGANTGSLIAILIGTLAPTLATLVSLAKMGKVSAQVDELGNGLMQAKVRTALADVLQAHLIDPAAAPQLAEDRARDAHA